MNKHSWIAMGIVIVFLGLEFSTIKDFKQLPSPLYGGDIYYHFSVINHIYNGGSPLRSSQFLNEWAHYPWFFHWLVAMTAKATGLSVLKTTLFFPLIITVLAGFVSFLIGKKLFGETVGVLFMALWTLQVPSSVASSFASLVTFPLFVYLLFYSKTLSSRILAGILYGLVGLGHVAVFIAANIFIGLFFLWRLYVNKHDLRHQVLKEIKHILPVLIVGVPIALLFWAPAFFVYKGVTPNNWASYVARGDRLYVRDIVDVVKTLFFNNSSYLSLTFSLLSLVGLVFIVKKKRQELFMPVLVFASAFVGFIHPMFSLPLFGVSLGYYGFGYVFAFSSAALAVAGFFVIYNSLPGKGRLACAIVFSLLIILSAQDVLSRFKNDRWSGVGREFPSQTRMMFEAAEWIKTNVANDEVILASHEETGFAVNALTGKKILIARRTHTSPFVDMNERVADAAVIMYGNNFVLAKELLKKYNIQFFYEDAYSYSEVSNCQKVFQHLGRPEAGDASFACLRVLPSFENYLKSNGVNTTRTHARLDPASAEAPQFDLVVIYPKRSDFFEQSLKTEKELAVQGVPIARISKIEI